MQELQCLFALMLGTRRKFVDPSAALELLRDAFRSAEEQQVKPRYKAFCFFSNQHLLTEILFHFILLFSESSSLVGQLTSSCPCVT